MVLVCDKIKLAPCQKEMVVGGLTFPIFPIHKLLEWGGTSDREDERTVIKKEWAGRDIAAVSVQLDFSIRPLRLLKSSRSDISKPTGHPTRPPLNHSSPVSLPSGNSCIFLVNTLTVTLSVWHPNCEWLDQSSRLITALFIETLVNCVLQTNQCIWHQRGHTMSFPDKEKRQKCWDSRDRYWECLDKSGDQSDKCAEIRTLYESACPSQWVSLNDYFLFQSILPFSQIRFFFDQLDHLKKEVKTR